MEQYVLRLLLLLYVETVMADVRNARIYSISKSSSGMENQASSGLSKTENVALSQCAVNCTADEMCLVAASKEQTGWCGIFKNAIGLLDDATDSEAIYAERIEDCCYWDGSSLENHSPIYQDCQDAFEKGERNSGAVYVLRPDSNWGLVKAVCQFDDASGWTLIQRRMDGSVDFYRGWNDYVDGFGYLDREYWIGLEAIYHLTQQNQKLSVYLEAHDGEGRTANYSSFYIDNADMEYANHVSGYSGNAGDSWSHHDGLEFSTFDRDNDLASYNCAARFYGGWWYHSCHQANMNGRWSDVGNYLYGEGIVWYQWKDHEYSFRTVYIRVGR